MYFLRVFVPVLLVVLFVACSSAGDPTVSSPSSPVAAIITLTASASTPPVPAQPQELAAPLKMSNGILADSLIAPTSLSAAQAAVKPEALTPSVIASPESAAPAQILAQGGPAGNSIYNPATNVHIAPARGTNGQSPIAAAPSSTANMTYHGGPIQQSVAAYTIFWSPTGTISSSYRTFINRYFQDVGRSGFFNVNSSTTKILGLLSFRTSPPLVAPGSTRTPIPVAEEPLSSRCRIPISKTRSHVRSA